MGRWVLFFYFERFASLSVPSVSDTWMILYLWMYLVQVLYIIYKNTRPPSPMSPKAEKMLVYL